MKKIAISLVLALVAVFAASAQKFALVDMEYIFRSVPSYEMANEQLNQLSQRWQKEVEAKGKEAENMYNSYLADKVFLTDEQVKKREADIVAKEKETTELRYKKVAEERGYQTVFDRASSSDIIYASPRIDISNEVLSKLGYSN